MKITVLKFVIHLLWDTPSHDRGIPPYERRKPLLTDEVHNKSTNKMSHFSPTCEHQPRPLEVLCQAAYLPLMSLVPPAACLSHAASMPPTSMFSVMRLGVPSTETWYSR